jgi:AcrR family transcriptional regulator
VADRKRPEERREEILRAAGEVVLRAGFGRMSARELAAELGVSPGLLHHYFPSLDEVMVRAVELFTAEDLDQLAAAVGAPDVPPLVRLDRLLRFCEPTAEDPSCRFWVESWAEALRNPGLREPTSRLNDLWQQGLVELLTEAADAGHATCPDPDGTARRLLAVVDGLTVQSLVHRSLGPGEFLSLVRTAAESELGLPSGTLADATGDRLHRRVRTVRATPD